MSNDKGLDARRQAVSTMSIPELASAWALVAIAAELAELRKTIEAKQ